MQPPQLPLSQPPSRPPLQSPPTTATSLPLLPPMHPPSQPPDISNLYKDPSALPASPVGLLGPPGISFGTSGSSTGLVGPPLAAPLGSLMESSPVDHSKECLGLPLASLLGEAPRHVPPPPDGLLEALQRGALTPAAEDGALPLGKQVGLQQTALGLDKLGLAPPLPCLPGGLSAASNAQPNSKMMSVAELEQRMVQGISGTQPSAPSTFHAAAAATSGLSSALSAESNSSLSGGSQTQAMQNLLQKMFEQQSPAPQAQRDEAFGVCMPPLPLGLGGGYPASGYPPFPFFGDPHAYYAGARPYAGHPSFASSPAYGSATYGGFPYGANGFGGIPFTGSFPGASPFPPNLYGAHGVESAHLKESSLGAIAERARIIAELSKDLSREHQGRGQLACRENEICAPSYEPR